MKGFMKINNALLYHSSILLLNSVNKLTKITFIDNIMLTYNLKEPSVINTSNYRWLYVASSEYKLPPSVYL